MKSKYAYQPHANEMHTDKSGTRQNWLRASVLGAQDGIVSVASIVAGVAGASSSSHLLLTIGVAALVAGALSMAAGEYVSVSSQRDSERALLAKEKLELHTEPELELEELTSLYEAKGLQRATAEVVAHELTAHDVFAAHVDAELGIDPNNLTSPWQAAAASAAAFSIGAVIPLIAVILPPADIRIPVAFVAVLVALIVTGVLSAMASGANLSKATIRVVVGGVFAMAVTYGIGKVLGVSGI